MISRGNRYRIVSDCIHRTEWRQAERPFHALRASWAAALLAEFERRGPLLRICYYTTVLAADEFTAVQPLLDWLEYNRFTVRTNPFHEHDDGEGRRRFKRSIVVDLAIDAMETAGYIDRPSIQTSLTSTTGPRVVSKAERTFIQAWGRVCKRPWPCKDALGDVDAGRSDGLRPRRRSGA